jgi:hypothetical protein
MAEPTIVCPKCKTEIKLTESLAAPMIDAVRRDFESRMQQKDQEAARKLEQETKRIEAEAGARARQIVDDDLQRQKQDAAELRRLLQEREAKLAEAQKQQAEMLRKERDLDDARRELELTIEKRVQSDIGAARDRAKRDAEEEMKLKVLEKEHTITAMQSQIEDLKRRAEQGSQQLQGEVQELELEATLRARFPQDEITPVGKGEFGADISQRVMGPFGQACGTIVWESKRTKHWNDDWLPKLRADQRAAKAEIAVIVSQALPKEIDTFDLIDGVYVTHSRTALAVAMTLRQSLIELAAARQSSEGQQTKMEMVYGYLTGPRFRQRVQAIVEAFTSMKEDLDRERKAIMKQWAKRDEQIDRVMMATVGMYGDLQGIAGKTLQEIEGMEFLALPDVVKDAREGDN